MPRRLTPPRCGEPDRPSLRLTSWLGRPCSRRGRPDWRGGSLQSAAGKRRIDPAFRLKSRDFRFRKGDLLPITGTSVGRPAHNALRHEGQPTRRDSTMRNVLAAACLTAAAVFIAPPAYADPAPDPHMPNMQVGYCPGGGMGSQISLAYCDGVPYPDGSYWHAIQYGAPMIGHPYGLLSPGLQCVVGGGAVPQPAPPGGCGGAVPPPPPPPPQWSVSPAAATPPRGGHDLQRWHWQRANFRRRGAQWWDHHRAAAGHGPTGQMFNRLDRNFWLTVRPCFVVNRETIIPRPTRLKGVDSNAKSCHDSCRGGIHDRHVGHCYRHANRASGSNHASPPDADRAAARLQWHYRRPRLRPRVLLAERRPRMGVLPLQLIGWRPHAASVSPLPERIRQDARPLVGTNAP